MEERLRKLLKEAEVDPQSTIICINAKRVGFFNPKFKVGDSIVVRRVRGEDRKRAPVFVHFMDKYAGKVDEVEEVSCQRDRATGESFIQYKLKGSDYVYRESWLRATTEKEKRRK